MRIVKETDSLCRDTQAFNTLLDRPNSLPLSLPSFVAVERQARLKGCIQRGILNCPPLSRLYKSFSPKQCVSLPIHTRAREDRSINTDTHRNNVFQFWYGQYQSRYTKDTNAPILRAAGGGAMNGRIPRPTLSETKTRMFQSPSGGRTLSTLSPSHAIYANHFT